MQVLESFVENRVIKWAINRGFIAAKVKFVEAGYPDRLFISPSGVHIWIEFKRVGKEPERIQEYRMEELRRRNVIVTWTDSYEDAVAFLQFCLDAPRVPEEGDETPLDPRSGRPVPRSRSGENLDLLSDLPDLKEEGAGKEDANHSPAPTHAQGVAGRDQEVD